MTPHYSQMDLDQKPPRQSQPVQITLSNSTRQRHHRQHCQSLRRTSHPPHTPTHASPTKDGPYILNPTNKPAFTNSESMTILHNPTSPNTGLKSGTIQLTPPSTGLPWPILLCPYPPPNKDAYPNTPPVTSDAAPNSLNGNTRITTLVPCATTQKTHNTSYSVHTLNHK